MKEALFCHVYEQSAWRFAELIKPYKASKKRIKKLSMDVVSIGFPKSQIAAIVDIACQNGFLVAQEGSDSLTILLQREPEIGFTKWKENIALHETAQPRVKDNNVVHTQAERYSVVKEIELFTVADHTPMQSMQFLVDLQNKIKLVKKMPE